MGADCYIGDIDSTDDADYFRDSYNGSSLFARLGMSWTEVMKTFGDEHGDIAPQQASELVTIIRNIDLATCKPAPHGAVWMVEALQKLAGPDATIVSGDRAPGEVSDGLDDKYFAEKKAAFLAFLQRAVELQKPIIVSY